MATKLSFEKITYITGLVGVAVVSMGSLVTAIVYSGREGEKYSVFNHFISELGEIGVSKLASVFNASLIVSGILFLVFMIGLGLYIKSKAGYIITAIGAFSAIACSLVGVFPMNHLAIHTKVALSFFYGMLITIILFTLFILFDRKNRISRWLCLPAVLVSASLLAFIIIPRVGMSQHLWTLDPSKIVRPAFWALPFFEWTVFFTIVFWILSMCVFLRAKDMT